MAVEYVAALAGATGLLPVVTVTFGDPVCPDEISALNAAKRNGESRRNR
ncbi:MAG: hypothetical protein HC767_00885 [Akkermansiaceae bacterium]|nr:hypothetical protein [Akkermansiaceae bacterium]